MKTLGYIIISMLISVAGYGQSNLQPDTTKGKFIPTGIRIGFDLISSGEAVIDKGLQVFTQGEYNELQFAADIDFYRYFLNVEYGIYDRQWTRDDGYYINKGSHFKIGPDINFLHKDPDGSALFFGLRYSFSNFSDEIVYDYQNQFWGDGANRIENDNLKANWLELTTGLKVKLTKIIWLGYTARFKFGYSTDTFADKALIPHWVPGYGRASETSAWGLDYWLIVKVPFRKTEK